jgi:hypothetical protein
MGNISIYQPSNRERGYLQDSGCGCRGVESIDNTPVFREAGSVCSRESGAVLPFDIIINAEVRHSTRASPQQRTHTQPGNYYSGADRQRGREPTPGFAELSPHCSVPPAPIMH